MLNLLCFNRTFMELKFAYDGTQKTDQLFQSYLYGIEILYDGDTIMGSDSFNRTFMELKCVKPDIMTPRLLKVSIVPLWN